MSCWFWICFGFTCARLGFLVGFGVSTLRFSGLPILFGVLFWVRSLGFRFVGWFASVAFGCFDYLCSLGCLVLDSLGFSVSVDYQISDFCCFWCWLNGCFGWIWNCWFGGLQYWFAGFELRYVA